MPIGMWNSMTYNDEQSRLGSLVLHEINYGAVVFIMRYEPMIKRVGGPKTFT